MRKLFFLFLALICVAKTGRAATTYYVDYTNGSDTYDGTEKTHTTGVTGPWQHAPGMAGCSNNCAAYTSTGGNSWILKGCVTWPAVTLPWVPVYSAQTSTENAGGLDRTWWDTTVIGCSSAWNRPIINAGGVVAGSNNTVVDFHNFAFGLQYVEFKGGFFSASTPQLTYLLTAQNQSLAVSYDHLYFHGVTWTGVIDSCWLVGGDSHNPNLSPNASFHDNVLDLTDSLVGGYTACYALYGGPPIIYNNVVKNTSNGFVVNGSSSVHDNLITNVGPSLQYGPGGSGSYHGNGFEDNSTEGLNLYNNVIAHLASGVLGIWIGLVQGHTFTGWNNLLYDTQPNNVIDIANALPPSNGCGAGGQGAQYCNNSGTFNWYNNTVECGPDSAPTADCAAPNTSATAILFTNNHFVTTQSGGSTCIGTANCTGTTNLTQSKATASGQGYTSSETYAFSPVSGAGSTVAAGTNVPSVTSATTYACTEVSSPYVTVSCPALVAKARPATPDIGAYQFTTAPSSQPGNPASFVLLPPANLIAKAQ